jgi:phosphate-selective porin OprO/OprP
MERAAITDAFNYNRRLGLAFTVNDKASDKWTVQAGLFNEPINDGVFQHTGWQASLRGVFSPTLGFTRLHVGANLQHRQNRREAQGQQYRARPFSQLTDQRFIDTGTIAAKGDDVVGVELAAIHNGLHFAAEAQKVWVRGAYDPAEFLRQNSQADTNRTATGTPYNGDPSFWGGYAELGYYLTGESRSYTGGSFSRVKVRRPFNDGGWGAIQLNGRVEYVNLTDRVDTGSTALAAPFLVNGGKQLGLLGSLIWNPTDYVRFMAQYGHVNVTGGPRATVTVPGIPPVIGMFPAGTTTAADKRKFSVDTFAVRGQIDF